MPESAPALVENPACRTKPRRPQPRALSYAQHAAIRLTVAGLGSKAVARHIGVNHHTVGRWKQDPQFVAELERLRQQVTQLTVNDAARNAGYGSAPGPMSSGSPARGAGNVDADPDWDPDEMLERIHKLARQ